MTLFPETVGDMMNESILGRAQERGYIRIEAHQIRDFTVNKQKQVDDYPYGGGRGAVMQAIQEMEGEVPTVSAQRCNGAAECKKALMMLQAGKFDLDFIEGMACEGGCMYGPANLLSERLYTQARKKLLGSADDRGVVENAREQGFDKIHMHR